jgi:hypothetical protein
VLLNAVDDELKARTLLLLWRAWHLRNDAAHAEGLATVTGSALFLSSCGEWQACNQVKANRKLGTVVHPKSSKKPPGPNTGTMEEATPTPQGWVKINTDAGFCPVTGTASVGIIARSHTGEVLPSAWKSIRQCASAEEAETEACLQVWMDRNLTVPRWCVPCRMGIRRGQRGQTFNHVLRDANMAAHKLAKRAKHNHEWVVQRHEIPEEARSINIILAETAGEENDPPECNTNLFR